jgi:hypothetical protein
VIWRGQAGCAQYTWVDVTSRLMLTEAHTEHRVVFASVTLCSARRA